MTGRGTIHDGNEGVEFKLGQITGMLTGIVASLNEGKERHKGFDILHADHEQRIAKIESVDPHDKIPLIEKEIFEAKTRLKIYLAILMTGSAVVAYVIHEALALLGK